MLLDLEQITCTENLQQTLRAELADFKEMELASKDDLTIMKINEDTLHSNSINYNKRINELKNEIRELGQQRKTIVDQCKQQQTNLTLCEADIAKLKTERHGILMRAYVCDCTLIKVKLTCFNYRRKTFTSRYWREI